jgi:hypothetical protein
MIVLAAAWHPCFALLCLYYEVIYFTLINVKSFLRQSAFFETF